jgi:hypothetical protein
VHHHIAKLPASFLLKQIKDVPATVLSLNALFGNFSSFEQSI